MTTTRTTDAQLVQRFLDWQVNVKRRATTTTYGNGSLYERLLAWMEQGGLTFDALVVSDIEAFLVRPRPRVDRPKDSTIANEIWRLRPLFRWLASRNLVPASTLAAMEQAAEGTPKVRNEAPKPVPVATWRQLWLGELTDPERVAFGLGYFCGLRRSEIVPLAPQQFVDVPAPMIVGVTRKGGDVSGVRYGSCVTLYAARLPALIGDPETFLGPLTRLLESRRGRPALLDWDETKDTRSLPVGHGYPHAEGVPRVDMMNAHMDRALKRNGLADGAATPHMLRHSFCTNLIDLGVPLQEVSQLAGHKSLQITMRYIKAQDDPLAKYLASAPPEGTRRLSYSR